MIIDSKKSQLAKWIAEKKVTTKSDGLAEFIEHIVIILNKLNKEDLFFPKKYEILFEEYDLKAKGVFDKSYWKAILEKYEDSNYSIRLFGSTMIYEAGSHENYENTLDIYFGANIKNNTLEMDFYVRVMADNFAPNFLINRCDPNLDYEKNHGRLNQLLKWLVARDYDVFAPEDSNNMARLIDLEIINYADEGHIFTYDERGRLLDVHPLNTVDFRGKLIDDD